MSGVRWGGGKGEEGEEESRYQGTVKDYILVGLLHHSNRFHILRRKCN